jgi:succinate-semialdehyde dehydrogenase/glutarate-semialdehyde dehydrogenase
MDGALRLSDTSLLRDRALIDGSWISAASGSTFAVENPATGSLVGLVPDMGVADVRAAIACAEKAGPAWAALPAKERSQALRRWFDLMVAHGEDLARIVTAEQGKPLAEARAELAYAASFVEWFAEEACAAGRIDASERKLPSANAYCGISGA